MHLLVMPLGPVLLGRGRQGQALPVQRQQSGGRPTTEQGPDAASSSSGSSDVLVDANAQFLIDGRRRLALAGREHDSV